MPVSARPERFESLGPIERFPRPPNRDLMVTYFGLICEPECTAHERMASGVFTYTPNADHAITRVKSVKWYEKGAAKVKKVIKNRIWK
jgi:hypothetical protein